MSSSGTDYTRFWMCELLIWLWKEFLIVCEQLSSDALKSPEGHLNKKMPSYGYRNSYYKDKIDLYDGNPHYWKDSLYIKIGALDVLVSLIYIWVWSNPWWPNDTIWCYWFGLRVWRNTWVCFLSLAQNKIRLCLANERADYFSNLACNSLSIV